MEDKANCQLSTFHKFYAYQKLSPVFASKVRLTKGKFNHVAKQFNQGRVVDVLKLQKRVKQGGAERIRGRRATSRINFVPMAAYHVQQVHFLQTFDTLYSFQRVLQRG
jgi:hypothetical protein